MKIRDMMTPQCEWVAPETTVVDVARLMREKDIGFVPVGENDKLIGVITDRDIVLRCISHDHDPVITDARVIMSEGCKYCYDDMDIEEVMDNMGHEQISRLAVVNREKRLVGVISLANCAKADRDDTGEAMQNIKKAA